MFYKEDCDRTYFYKYDMNSYPDKFEFLPVEGCSMMTLDTYSKLCNIDNCDNSSANPKIEAMEVFAWDYAAFLKTKDAQEVPALSDEGVDYLSSSLKEKLRNNQFCDKQSPYELLK
jgi:hypothetical protein